MKKDNLNFKNVIVFDLETIPDTTLAGELCNISDDELKQKTEQELRQEMANYHIDNHNGNDFLRQPFHRIVCISFLEAKIDLDFGKEQYSFQQLSSYSSFNSTEEKVVRKFWDLFKKKKPLRLVSFNGKEFDINVLKCKALKYGINCDWYFEFGEKYYDSYEYPYSNSHFDLSRKYGAYTLHEICILLNVPCKLGVNGSQVPKYFDEKKYEEIREYCETDVLATYIVYLHMAYTQGWIDKDEYNKDITDVENHLIEKQNEKIGLKEFLDEWHRLNPNGILLK